MVGRFLTVRDLIYWEYAKLISGSAIGERSNFAFVNHTYQKLRQSRITPSSILSENKLLVHEGNRCTYCGSGGALEWEHVIPLAKGGPDTIDNLVRACRTCNAKKGVRDPYEWILGAEGGEIPRLALGKLLKLTFDAYLTSGSLDSPEFMRERQVKRVTLATIFNEAAKRSARLS